MDGSGWCALEYVAEDRGKAVAEVFRLVKAEGDAYRLRFRRLNKNLSFAMQMQPGEERFEASGFVLSNEGLETRLDTSLTSRLILLTIVAGAAD